MPSEPIVRAQGDIVRLVGWSQVAAESDQAVAPLRGDGGAGVAEEILTPDRFEPGLVLFLHPIAQIVLLEAIG